MSKKIILITGASSGFGRPTAEALAKAGNTVYASMRDIAGRNAKNAAEMAATSKRDGVDLRAIELDVQPELSIDVAVKKIMAESGKVDVLVHNAGHMMFGPAEAFLPEQFAVQYDVNVLGLKSPTPLGPALPSAVIQLRKAASFRKKRPGVDLVSYQTSCH